MLYYRMDHKHSRTHKTTTKITKVIVDCQIKCCKLGVPLLYCKVHCKHIMLSTRGTSILLQNACTTIEMQLVGYPWKYNTSLEIAKRKKS
jgi:hypothetical protein